MTPVTYARAGNAEEALRFGTAGGMAYLGGGTNLVDLMRETIARPTALVDVTGLSNTIVETHDGGLLIGSAVRNTALVEHQLVRTLSDADARNPGGRVGADQEHGDCRWQHPPANALHLFLR